jgi:hypothetical protein
VGVGRKIGVRGWQKWVAVGGRLTARERGRDWDLVSGYRRKGGYQYVVEWGSVLVCRNRKISRGKRVVLMGGYGSEEISWWEGKELSFHFFSQYAEG